MNTAASSITHVFSCINICRVSGCCLNTRLIRRVFKHLPRDPASVNAMKQTCVIIILAYFTLFLPNSHQHAAKTLNCPSSYAGFLQTKWRRLGTFECHNIVTMSYANASFSEQKQRQNDQSGPLRFPYNNAGLILSIFKFRPMFK